VDKVINISFVIEKRQYELKNFTLESLSSLVFTWWKGLETSLRWSTFQILRASLANFASLSVMNNKRFYNNDTCSQFHKNVMPVVTYGTSKIS
jgi:hypothetical protein